MWTFHRVLAMSGLLITSAVSTGAASPALAADTADLFDPSQAIINGSGCTSGDTSVSASGTGLRVSFSAMQLSLGSGSPQLGNRGCSVRLPYTPPAGYRIVSINQRLHYGVDKSANTSGAITGSSVVSVAHVAGVSVQIPSGVSMSNPSLVATRRAGFAGPASCDGVGGLFGVDTNMSASKDTASDAINMSVTGVDVDVVLAPCS